MEWYYVSEGQKRGPVSKTDIQDLVKSGKIGGETLVWREGMADWQTLASLRRQRTPSKPDSEPGDAASHPTPERSGGRDVALKQKDRPDHAHPERPRLRDLELKPKVPPGASVAQKTCSQCGGAFPEDETILYEGARICAGCKPLFMKKLKEGVRVSGEMEYGGFWIRFGAKIIDGIIIGLVQLLVSSPFYFLFSSSSETFSSSFILIQIIGLALPAAYATWFVGKYGATPGKMACKLSIVTSDGGKVSYARALGRHFAEWLSSIILMIGYLMAAFDSEKRALHDRVCDTRVIRVDR